MEKLTNKLLLVIIILLLMIVAFLIGKSPTLFQSFSLTKPTPTFLPILSISPTISSPTKGSKHVNKGDVIGFMGNSGSSTYTHLHFSVYNLKETDLDKFNSNVGYENPFNYLQTREVSFEVNSCDDISEKTTKSIGGGTWDWPLSNPTISQCYGHTPLSGNNQQGVNNGIDMWDHSNTFVRAVESGNAYIYRGGQSSGNGVFIFHDNGKMTLYWNLQ